MSTCYFEGILIYFYDMYDINTCDYIYSFTQDRTLHMDQPLKIQ